MTSPSIKIPPGRSSTHIATPDRSNKSYQFVGFSCKSDFIPLETGLRKISLNQSHL